MPLPSPQGLLIGFIVLLVAFRALELLRPKERRLRIFRRGFRTDLAYWVFTPYVSGALAHLCVIALLVPFALVVYRRIDDDLLLNGFGPVGALPLWMQAIGIVVVGDLVGYWLHRAFHRGRLWRFHAVHHSSVDLDWLSSLRQHPVNEMVTRTMSALPILALGFAPVAVAGVLPVLGLLAILLHANLDWDWGPLRGVIVSPRFHRWHHADEPEAHGKNFAGVLPLWDILFGTYYMPRDRVPLHFGAGMPVPQGLWGQLIFPFRREAAAASARRSPRPAPTETVSGRPS